MRYAYWVNCNDLFIQTVIFLSNGLEVDMPWPLMDLNPLQVDVMVVDASITSGSRHALVVHVR